MINALTCIDGLRVASRTASFQFRGAGADIRAVGQHLGVGALLEGSVRKAGDRLRVTVQLIEVATGFHRWSQRFDRNLDDVFAIQDEIAESVATSVLYPDDAGTLVNAACLRAKLGQKEEALEFLERVFARGWGKRDWVEHDPDYDIMRDDPWFKKLLARLK